MAYIVQSRHTRNVVLSAILCAALAPGNVGAATLRMVVQSHPSLGGKCIDVANHQILPGMPVQMSDCNNGLAQSFSYDETSQQLTIGNLCVESWGQGHPQDSVRLGSCDNGVKQHWRVVAAGEYYKFIGVGGLCLDIRDGDKENGAPLQISPCGDALGTPAAQQLWALIEAPPAPASPTGQPASPTGQPVTTARGWDHTPSVAECTQFMENHGGKITNSVLNCFSMAKATGKDLIRRPGDSSGVFEVNGKRYECISRGRNVERACHPVE
jgi:hypothetical protein